MKKSDPHADEHLDDEADKTRDNPKSAILIIGADDLRWGSTCTRILSGFKSRWTTSCLILIHFEAIIKSSGQNFNRT